MEPTLSPAAPFKDRRAALMVVGILEIVMGCGAWLMTGLLIFSVSVAARQAGTPISSMIPGILVYGVAGTVLIVFGIGSIRARRWARALSVVLATGWSICGVLTAVGMAVWFPKIIRSSMPPGVAGPPAAVMNVVFGVMFVILAVFMIAVPLALLLFYRSPHVRATCEAVQPAPDWTDACPLPVLGAVVWFSMMAVSLTAMPFAYRGIFPMFGTLVSGAVGVLAWGISAAACAAAAIGLYRLRGWAWWLALLLLLGLGTSGVVTYLRADVMELYRAMGLQDAQLEMIQRMGFASPGYMVGSTLIAVVPFIGLLLWIRPMLRAGARRQGGSKEV